MAHQAHDRGRLLGQLRPANTTAATIYSPTAGVQALITQVVVTESTGTTHNFSIFLDHDGTTYTEATALFWEEALAADTARIIDSSWWMTDSTGNLAVKTDTNDAFTFTVFGVEYEV